MVTIDGETHNTDCEIKIPLSQDLRACYLGALAVRAS